MRILMVVRPAEGGMKQHVLTLCAGLTAAGHTVEIAAPVDSNIAVDARDAGLPVRELVLAGPLSPVSDLRAIATLRSLVVRGAYDLVHAHGFKAGLITRAASGTVARGKRPPVLVTVHNHVLFRTDVSGASKWFYRVAERLLSGRTSRYIAVSDSIRRELIEGYGLPADKITVIHNGIDPAPFLAPQDREAARVDLDLPSPDALVIGVVARFSVQKGLRHLIAAVPALIEELHPVRRQFVVALAGSGPLQSELKEQAAELGVSDHVRWLGPVSSTPRFLSGLDVYVSPAETEAFGIGLVEAGLAGVPVVATKVGGVPEVVLEGETGVLVPAASPYVLAREITLLVNDPERIQVLTAAARSFCLERFAAQRMIERTLDACNDVVGCQSA